jgi:hypothetical protein
MDSVREVVVLHTPTDTTKNDNNTQQQQRSARPQSPSLQQPKFLSDVVGELRCIY